MSLPNIFAAQTQPNLQMLDENFAALGVLTPIHSSASGTNAITLTPATDTPTISAYLDQMQFTAVAAGTNSTAVTAQVGSLGVKNVYKPTSGGPQVLSGGEIVSGSAIVLMYQTSLASGAGGFLLVNPVTDLTNAAFSGQVQGAFAKLAVEVTSDTALTVLVDSICVGDGVAAYNTVRAVNLTFNTALAAGLLSMDTGTIGNDTWYAVYVIYNPNTQQKSGVLSASFTAPSQANTAGYTQYARVGAVRTGSTADLKRTIQKGRRAQYKVVTASNVPNYPTMISGSSGSPTIPTWTAQAVSSYVPTTASEIIVYVTGSDNAGGFVIAAPNNSAGPAGTSSNTPPVGITLGVGTGTALFFSSYASFILESSNVYYAANHSSGKLNCVGWVDNL